MKKLLKLTKRLLLFLFLSIVVLSCGETEAEYYERLRKEEAEEAIKNCPILPTDFDPFLFHLLRYKRKGGGENGSDLNITLNVNSPLFEDDKLDFVIDEDFNYELVLKSQTINYFDSTATLDFIDRGKFTLEESNFTYDNGWVNREYTYEMISEIDPLFTFSESFHEVCNVFILEYSKRLNERDSVYVKFAAIHN